MIAPRRGANEKAVILHLENIEGNSTLAIFDQERRIGSAGGDKEGSPPRGAGDIAGQEAGHSHGGRHIQDDFGLRVGSGERRCLIRWGSLGMESISDDMPGNRGAS